jgi:2-methylcitrate dehydratase PrpD
MIVNDLSKFLIDLKYENIPKNIIEKTKLCFLDYLSVTNRGFYEESSQIAIQTLNQIFSMNIQNIVYNQDNISNNIYNKSNNPNNISNNINNVSNNPNSISNNINNKYKNHSTDYDDISSNYILNNGSKSCSIIGNGYSNVLYAGFINGISAHSLDLDDGHRVAQLHPGSVIFSSALSVCEFENLTCEKFLEAVVGGYEIAIVLGKLFNPSHRNQGFHSTGTIGSIAAGATVAKLLDLNIKQFKSTLGLSGTQSSGLLETGHQGTMGKHLHVGNAVYTGILSGFLSKNGFTGAESIIDGDEGFLKALSTGAYNKINIKLKENETYLNDYLNKELGKFHIDTVYLKKYPVCRHLHSGIDSTIAIRNKLLNTMDLNNGNIVESIKKIRIESYKIASEHDSYDVKTKEDLKQSLPYSVAIAMIFGDLNIDLINDIFKKQDLLLLVRNLANKICIRCDEELDEMFPNKRPTRIIVETNSQNNQRIFKDTTYIPYGEKEKPFSKKDILNKCKKLNPHIDLNKFIAIDTMESLKVREIVALLLSN